MHSDPLALQRSVDTYSKKRKFFTIIGTVTLLAGAGFLAYKLSSRYDSLRFISASEINPLSPPPAALHNKTLSVDVPSYLRALPKGQKASSSKLEEAKRLGIDLGEQFTIVSSYNYTRSVA